MKSVMAIIVCLGLSMGVVAQGYIIDPEFIEMGTRYRKHVDRLYYDSLDNKLIVMGSFSFGEPTVPYIHKIKLDGNFVLPWQWDFDCFPTWDGNHFRLNFLRVSNGYRTGENMALFGLNGSCEPGTAFTINDDPWFRSGNPVGWADDQDRIYAGASWELATDTGWLDTGVLRFHPDGSLDTLFPIIKGGITANDVFPSQSVGQIVEYDDQRIMLSGYFNYLNDHYTPQLGRVFKDGTVDTSFVSPLKESFSPYINHVDSQGRILVCQPEGGLASAPEDTVQVWRLMPNGSVDTTFSGIKLNYSIAGYSGQFSINPMVPTSDKGYIVYGSFDHINGEPRMCLAKIDSSGNLDPVMFANNPLAHDTLVHPSNVPTTTFFNRYAYISHIIDTPDGGLLVGGLFTHYAGVERFNLVKLIPDGTVGTSPIAEAAQLKLYPNPAGDFIHIQIPNSGALVDEIAVYDLTGRLVLLKSGSVPQRIDISNLPAGLYLVQAKTENGVYTGKVVVE
jgi:hypothetical protein